jgi:hypothetical protein
MAFQIAALPIVAHCARIWAHSAASFGKAQPTKLRFVAVVGRGDP